WIRGEVELAIHHRHALAVGKSERIDAAHLLRAVRGAVALPNLLIRGEQQLTVDDGEPFGVRIAGSRNDVAHHLRALGRAVALPQLASVRVIDGGEIERVPD